MSKKAKAVRYDDINGKVVVGAGFGWDTMLVAFTDGTVLALSVDDSGDGSEIDFKQTDIDLFSKQWRGVAYEAGLVTADEWSAAEANDSAQKIKRMQDEIASLKASIARVKKGEAE